MYYENFEHLCNINNVKPSQVSKATNISTATLTSWKQGKYTPKPDKLELIADFFKVSLNYLMYGEEPEMSKYSTEMAHLVSKIRNDAELSKALLLYFELPENKKKHVVDTIKILSEV